MTETHFDYYRIGIRRLLDAIGPNQPSYTEVLTLQQRLGENLNDSERFGSTPSLQAERARILDICNRLSLSATGRSFHYFCDLPEPPTSPQERAEELFRQATRHQIRGDLGYALQLFRQVEDLAPDYPRINATTSAVEKEMQAPYVDLYGHVRERDVIRISSHFDELWPTPAPYCGIGCGAYIAAAIVIVVVMALFILLYLWLRGALG